MATDARLPDRPNIVLRVGFAGSRQLDSGRNLVSQSLRLVFDTLAQQLESQRRSSAKATAEGLKYYYNVDSPPTIRLISGLAEGSDALAAATALSSQSPQSRVELAGVLPFGVEAYRLSRPEAFRAEFDNLLQKCSYVMVLDGHHEKGSPSDDYLRARSYRTMSQVLLRQCDILVTVSDFSRIGKAGGTQETIEAALAADVPVVFIHVESGAIHLLEPGTDWVTALTTHGPGMEYSQANEMERLRDWTANIIAPPDGTEFSTAGNHDNRLLEEFFGDPTHPPRRPDGSRKISWRERTWVRLEKAFRQPADHLPTESRVEPLSALRQRATELSYHYAGLYRGAFVVNYMLAVIAVALAAASLFLLGTQHTTPIKWIAAIVPHANPATSQTVVHTFALACLGILKLIFVATIYFNTKRANKEDWNDKAVDYRYLAERLRSMLYLPFAGSLQPPSASRPRYASRIVRQSAVDWLFHAYVRQFSPAVLAPAGTNLVTLNPRSTLGLLKLQWIDAQIAYHRRNASMMNKIQQFTVRWGKRLNVIVMVAVGFDLALLLLVALAEFPKAATDIVHSATPWLVFLAALLPAAVASLNGLRFQSECGRLADRSAVVARFLENRSAEAERLALRLAPASALPSPAISCLPEVLRLAEGCARDLVEEVTEWSVLYAKDVVEP